MASFPLFSYLTWIITSIEHIQQFKISPSFVHGFVDKIVHNIEYIQIRVKAAGSVVIATHALLDRVIDLRVCKIFAYELVVVIQSA